MQKYLSLFKVVAKDTILYFHWNWFTDLDFIEVVRHDRIVADDVITLSMSNHGEWRFSFFTVLYISEVIYMF